MKRVELGLEDNVLVDNQFGNLKLDIKLGRF